MPSTVRFTIGAPAHCTAFARMTTLAEAGNATVIDAVAVPFNVKAAPADAFGSRTTNPREAGTTFIDSPSTVVACAAAASGVVRQEMTTAAVIPMTANEASNARTANMGAPSTDDPIKITASTLFT